MAGKVALYSTIHKGQRKWFYDISTQLGRMDFSDNSQIDTIHEQVKTVYQHIKEHGGLEERFIHPKLWDIVPICPRRIEADHKVMHQDLEDMLKSLDKLKLVPKTHEALPVMVHEFYLAWNRFVSFYLTHIDFEEDHVQHILMNACTGDELMETFKTILGAQTAPQLMQNLKIMISAMDIGELTGMLSQAKFILPASVFSEVVAFAASDLEASRWLR